MHIPDMCVPYLSVYGIFCTYACTGIPAAIRHNQDPADYRRGNRKPY